MANSLIKVVSDDISEIPSVNVEMLEHEDGEFQLINNNPNVARKSTTVDVLLKGAAENGGKAFNIFKEH